MINACSLLTYVTRLPCDTFGLYIALAYLQKAVEILLLQWDYTGNASAAAPYLAIVVALLVMIFGFACSLIGETKLFGPFWQKVIEDYGLPLTVIFFSGFVHIGKMRAIQLEALPVAAAFSPTADRSWVIPFWSADAGTVFYAVPYAFAITILFYFDHNVSALMSQGSEFPLRKPPGFHWDFLVLGVIMGVCGILGLPFPNGLIPQGPLHTKSLIVTKVDLDEKGQRMQKSDHVVEQRVSHLSQGLLFLATMSGPLLTALNQIPQAVLSGLFIVMGLQTLATNGVVTKILYLASDKQLTQQDSSLRDCRLLAVWSIVGLQLLTFAACFAVTQTLAAIAFPIFIVFLIPCRVWLMPRWMRKEELAVLDGPVASEFVMQSVGGNAKL